MEIVKYPMKIIKANEWKYILFLRLHSKGAYIFHFYRKKKICLKFYSKKKKLTDTKNYEAEPKKWGLGIKTKNGYL